jgi:hypothetical protein
MGKTQILEAQTKVIVAKKEEHKLDAEAYDDSLGVRRCILEMRKEKREDVATAPASGSG